MPGRYREPQHVSERPRIPVRDRAGQARDLRRQDRLRRNHPLQEGQPARVVAGGFPAEQISVHELPGEPHPHPAARDGGLVEPLRHQVIERPVEMREGKIDGDAGDREMSGGNRSYPEPPCPPARGRRCP
jgi:hypothetical protein